MADFDWVTARAKCSLAPMFEQLVVDVMADVDTRNAQRTGPPFDYVFSASAKGDLLAVALEGAKGIPSKRVSFRLGESSIIARDDGAVTIFEATLTINDQRQCRFKINGQERESWQLRLMALEHLLFETV